VGAGGLNEFIQASWIFWVFNSSIDRSGFCIVAAIMGSDMQGREVCRDLFSNPMFSYLFSQDAGKMGDSDASLIPHSQPFEEVSVDLFPEFFILLDFMIGLCEGTTTSTAKGTEGMALFFGEGQIASSHQQIGITMD
jgi:hypothetical protein